MSRREVRLGGTRILDVGPALLPWGRRLYGFGCIAVLLILPAPFGFPPPRHRRVLLSSEVPRAVGRSSQVFLDN